MKPYDGSLGYEALVCRACGKYFDHNGEHPADEWSTNYVKMNTVDIEHLGDGVYAFWDGFGVEIRVNDHRSPVAVYFEPDVVAALGKFLDRKRQEDSK